MDSVAIRVFTFSILPIIIAVGHLGLDRSSRRRDRRLGIFLLYLFGVGVAGSGIGGFFGHVFISESVAESIGWPAGNPFQLEVGVANLALGILGIVAMGRRDGFREATVIAATVSGVGATVRPQHPRGTHHDLQTGPAAPTTSRGGITLSGGEGSGRTRTVPPLGRYSWPVGIAAGAAPNRLFRRVGRKYRGVP